MPDYDVFVSYRRDGGGETARLISFALAAHGVKAFLDVDNLGSGHFDDRLLKVIADAPHFIVVLSEDSLKRCRDPGDWVRKEIVQALATQRNIIPVMVGSFAFDSHPLPDELAGLPRHNGVRYNHEYFDAVVGRLLEYMGKSRTAAPAAAPVPTVQSPDYVFLDFDGVLRPLHGPRYLFDTNCLRAFEELMRLHPATKIVVTSSWRIAMSKHELGKQFSEDIRARIAGATPFDEEEPDCARHREILSYLQSKGASNARWIAIDDDAENFPPGCRNLLLTDPGLGFDAEAARRLQALLGKI